MKIAFFVKLFFTILILASCRNQNNENIEYIHVLNSKILDSTSIDISLYVKKLDESGKKVEFYEEVLDSLIAWDNSILMEEIGNISFNNLVNISPEEYDSVLIKIANCMKSEISKNSEFGKMIHIYLDERVYYLKDKGRVVFNHRPSEFDIIIYQNYEKKAISIDEMKFFVVLSYVLTELNSKKIGSSPAPPQ